MFAFSERSFPTPDGPRAALVITPTRHVRIGADRLNETRPADTIDEVDRSILDQARARASRVDLTIFRGTDDEGRGSWGFAPEVGEAMAGRLAEHLLGSQMFVYRELMRVGLCLHLHAEFGPKEVVAFRDATDRRIELLERRTEGREPTGTPDADVVDLWILRNLTFYFGLGIDNLVDSILPEKLLLMEKRMARVHEMAIALPLPAALAG